MARGKKGTGVQTPSGEQTEYRFRARTAAGEVRSGSVQAETSEDVRSALSKQGLDVEEVKQRRGGSLRGQLQVGKGFRREDRILFCRQLATFARSGVPILTAMQIMTEQARTRVLRRAYASVSGALEEGESLSGAMETEPKVFPRMMTHQVRAAEQTGGLYNVLSQLAVHYERELAASRKIRRALSYPVLILGLALVVVTVLVAYVLPQFVKLFNEFSARLPLTARLLLASSKFLSHNWIFFLLGIVGVVGAGVLFSRSKSGRRFIHGTVLHTPIIGRITRAAIVDRWARTLAGMVRAGVPMDVALEVTRQTTGNVVFEERLRTVGDRVMSGEGMAGPLAATRLFPDMVVQMVRVSEEAGALDEHLEHLADFYEEELNYRIEQATAYIEPLVLIIVGGVVGFVATAMVSTMYGLSNAMK